MVDPEERQVEFHAETTGMEPPRPGAPTRLIPINETSYTVSEDVLDMNGHMNNTRYFDLAQDLAGKELEVRRIRQIRAVYSNEARLGDRLSVRWGREQEDWLFNGERNGDACFQISFHTA